MKQKTLTFFFVLPIVVAGIALSLPFPISARASSALMPITIDQFVAALFPQASHYFWVVNDSTEETRREMVVDINTFVTQKGRDAPTENRFLLLIRDGEIFAAQHIPLNATVDCGPDEKEV